MKRAIILGWYGYDNLGDELLLRATIRYHDNEFNHFYYLSPKDLGYKNATAFQISGKKGLFKWIWLLLKSNAVILGGGSYLRDTNNPKSLRFKLILLRLAQFLFKPVYIFSGSLGPFYHRGNTSLLQKVISRIKRITVRDEVSLKRGANYGAKLILCKPDPVFLLRDDLLRQCVSKKNHDKPTIGISLRQYPGLEVNEIADFIVHFKDSYKFVFLVFQSNTMDNDSTDETPINEVIQRVGNFEHEVVFLKNDLSQIAETYSQIDYLIGMRLHSLILADIFKIPSIAIAYEEKVSAFMSDKHRSDFSIDLSRLESELLVSKFEDIEHERL